MTDDRDICERLECPSYDGAMFMRRDAAKEIRYLRHYVAQLENNLAIAEDAVEHLRRYSNKQDLDIVTLGQEVGRLREALRGMEHAFVLLSEALRGSEVNIPLDAGLAIIQARETARVALAEKEEK